MQIYSLFQKKENRMQQQCMKHRAECTTFLSLVQIYKQFLTPARKQGLQALQKTKLLTRCEDLPAKQSYALETIRLNKLPSQQNFTNSIYNIYQLTAKVDASIHIVVEIPYWPGCTFFNVIRRLESPYFCTS